MARIKEPSKLELRAKDIRETLKSLYDTDSKDRIGIQKLVFVGMSVGNYDTFRNMIEDGSSKEQVREFLLGCLEPEKAENARKLIKERDFINESIRDLLAELSGIRENAKGALTLGPLKPGEIIALPLGSEMLMRRKPDGGPADIELFSYDV